MRITDEKPFFFLFSLLVPCASASLGDVLKLIIFPSLDGIHSFGAASGLRFRVGKFGWDRPAGLVTLLSPPESRDTLVYHYRSVVGVLEGRPFWAGVDWRLSGRPGLWGRSAFGTT